MRIIIIIIFIILSLFASPFLVVTFPLETTMITTASRLQVSDCSTYRVACDFPNVAIFCNDST
jgi:hypothetical protein